jgi:single-stranded-DNA-specific exonuclease
MTDAPAKTAALLLWGYPIGSRAVLADAENDDRQVLALSQRLGLPDLLCRMLAARGIDAEHAPGYLDPKLRDLLPDPSRLTDMDKAARAWRRRLSTNEPVAVFGDYDVDGATSSSLLIRAIGALVAEPCISIFPTAQKEGYGPNEAAFEKLHEKGYKLLVTVDCGTMAHDVLAQRQSRGQQVIVADHHHQTGGGLPDCFALINPRRADDESGLGHLAAVGVTFMLVVGLNRALRQQGYFNDREEPDLTHLLDLVALGTVCDVVPLQGINRAFVRQGLKSWQQGGNVGMQALGNSGRATPPYGARIRLGFQMGPRVNAGGRVGQADLGTRLLSTDDMEEAAGLRRG